MALSCLALPYGSCDCTPVISGHLDELSLCDAELQSLAFQEVKMRFMGPLFYVVYCGSVCHLCRCFPFDMLHTASASSKIMPSKRKSVPGHNQYKIHFTVGVEEL